MSDFFVRKELIQQFSEKLSKFIHGILVRFQEPLPFSEIPTDLQLEIIKKLEYKTFIAFDECCRLTTTLGGQNNGFRHVHYFPAVTFGLELEDAQFEIPEDCPVIIECKELDLMKPLTNELLETHSKILRKANSLICERTDELSPQFFTEFIQRIGLEILDITLSGTESEIPFDISTLEKVCCRNATSLSLETIFSINNKRCLIELCNISAQDIAQHILDWTEGTEWYDKDLYAKEELPAIEMDEVLEKLDRLDVEYQRLQYETEDHSEFCAIRRELEKDPILLLGISHTGWVGLRSPRKGEDDEALEELRITEEQQNRRQVYFVFRR